MSRYALSHLSDRTLLEGLAALVARDRATTAELLAHIAEVDARKLYLPAAYPSMYAYCVGELRLCEQAAFKRIQVARLARRFPEIFTAIADGRLHLSGVVLLSPYLTEDTARGLLAAASHQSKAAIERMLAERYAKSDVFAWVSAMPTGRDARPGMAGVSPLSGGPAGADEAPAAGAPGPVAGPAGDRPAACQLSPGIVGTAQVVDTPRVRPLTALSFSVQFTMSSASHEKLRRAQELLGHQIPSGDLAAVIDRALDALIERLEKQKFAATDRPRPIPQRESTDPRHIPAAVKRAVWARDQGRCTFVSETGRRCEARSPLEFDHALEVARGGESTASDIRLRCRAHNQYGAERTFGAEFMHHKRIAAAERRETGRERPPAGRAPSTRSRPGTRGRT